MDSFQACLHFQGFSMPKSCSKDFYNQLQTMLCPIKKDDNLTTKLGSHNRQIYILFKSYLQSRYQSAQKYRQFADNRMHTPERQRKLTYINERNEMAPKANYKFNLVDSDQVVVVICKQMRWKLKQRSLQRQQLIWRSSQT